jgi:hypothetical protein
VFLSSLPKLFILPTYMEDEAQAHATIISPPRIRNWLGYDLAFRNYLDDVAFK